MQDLSSQIQYDFLNFLNTFTFEYWENNLSKLFSFEQLVVNPDSIVNQTKQIQQRKHIYQPLNLVYEEQTKKFDTYSQNVFKVDFMHLLVYNEDLAFLLQDRYYYLEIYLLRTIAKFYASKLPHEEKLLDLDSEYSLRLLFSFSFFNLPNNEVSNFTLLQQERRLSSLISSSVGKLLCIEGTVTRTSQSYSRLFLGSFECQYCFTVIANVEQKFKFTTPRKCTNPKCVMYKPPGGEARATAFELLDEESKYVDWQKVTVQEPNELVTAGSAPRTITAVAEGHLVEKCKPGDKFFFTGVILAEPDSSKLANKGDLITSKAIRGDINTNEFKPQIGDDGIGGLRDLGSRRMGYSFCFRISSLKALQEEADPENKNETYHSALIEKVSSIKPNDFLQKLVRSFAPKIFGHEDIKLSILLLLVSGVSKPGLRGDINICLVGDPSVAKSQFLTFVADNHLLPRAIMTSGRASSAVGMTAAVARDHETGEFGVEAGALMLADGGVCCIDEFDKMQDKDQVAIHEAMEQQTISIAKAGIHATMQARASVLAAANPIGGRYDTSKSLRRNLNFTPAMMSRFDLFFIILDQCSEDVDRRIADHLLRAHCKAANVDSEMNDYDEAEECFLNVDELREYIALCKTINPVLDDSLQETLVNRYLKLRHLYTESNGYRITVRQLEAIIRLSEALAKICLDEKVRLEYVEVAFSLLQRSLKKTASVSEEDDKETNPAFLALTELGLDKNFGSALTLKQDEMEIQEQPTPQSTL
eukprot:snap_masked-scaffold_16-processed-gene-1.34-mRNA-1 protein AED:0.04 eAED:0.04 QI:0/-1/0/1/-1/1/1/0/758